MEKSKKLIRNRIVLFSIALLIFSCSKGDSDIPSIDDLREGCYYAYTSPNNAYLRVINTLNLDISIVYNDLPFGAHMSAQSCALLGVISNTSSSISIQQCESAGYDSEGSPVECGNNGPEVTVRYNLKSSETFEIIVDSDTFK